MKATYSFSAETYQFGFVNESGQLINPDIIQLRIAMPKDHGRQMVIIESGLVWFKGVLQP